MGIAWDSVRKAELPAFLNLPSQDLRFNKISRVSPRHTALCEALGQREKPGFGVNQKNLSSDFNSITYYMHEPQ